MHEDRDTSKFSRALRIFGVILAISLVALGIAVYRFATSESGKRIVSASSENARLTNDARSAPGASALATIGCDNGMVYDTEQMAAVLDRVSPDAGSATRATGERVLVMCQMLTTSKPAPSCEGVAKAYAAAVPPAQSADGFLAQVTVQGDNVPKCSERFSPTGQRKP